MHHAHAFRCTLWLQSMHVLRVIVSPLPKRIEFSEVHLISPTGTKQVDPHIKLNITTLILIIPIIIIICTILNDIETQYLDDYPLVMSANLLWQSCMISAFSFNCGDQSLIDSVIATCSQEIRQCCMTKIVG